MVNNPSVNSEKKSHAVWTRELSMSSLVKVFFFTYYKADNAIGICNTCSARKEGNKSLSDFNKNCFVKLVEYIIIFVHYILAFFTMAKM